MNKLIQTIVLTAVVFSPLSLLSLVTSAAADHSHSHASTVSLAGKKKPKLKNKKRQKSTTSSGVTDKKPAATGEAPSIQSPATGAPTVDSAPIKTGDPAKMPPASIPGTKGEPNGTDQKVSPSGSGAPTGAPSSAPSSAPGMPSTIPGGVTAPSGSPK
jgi:hypothetical protein